MDDVRRHFGQSGGSDSAFVREALGKNESLLDLVRDPDITGKAQDPATDAAIEDLETQARIAQLLGQETPPAAIVASPAEPVTAEEENAARAAVAEYLREPGQEGAAIEVESQPVLPAEPARATEVAPAARVTTEEAGTITAPSSEAQVAAPPVTEESVQRALSEPLPEEEMRTNRDEFIRLQLSALQEELSEKAGLSAGDLEGLNTALDSENAEAAMRAASALHDAKPESFTQEARTFLALASLPAEQNNYTLPGAKDALRQEALGNGHDLHSLAASIYQPSFLRDATIAVDSVTERLLVDLPSSLAYAVDGTNWLLGRVGLGSDKPFGRHEQVRGALKGAYESWFKLWGHEGSAAPQNKREQAIAMAGGVAADVAAVFGPALAPKMAQGFVSLNSMIRSGHSGAVRMMNGGAKAQIAAATDDITRAGSAPVQSADPVAAMAAKAADPAKAAVTSIDEMTRAGKALPEVVTSLRATGYTNAQVAQALNTAGKQADEVAGALLQHGLKADEASTAMIAGGFDDTAAAVTRAKTAVATTATRAHAAATARAAEPAGAAARAPEVVPPAAPAARGSGSATTAPTTQSATVTPQATSPANTATQSRQAGSIITNNRVTRAIGRKLKEWAVKGGAIGAVFGVLSAFYESALGAVAGLVATVGGAGLAGRAGGQMAARTALARPLAALAPRLLVPAAAAIGGTAVTGTGLAGAALGAGAAAYFFADESMEIGSQTFAAVRDARRDGKTWTQAALKGATALSNSFMAQAFGKQEETAIAEGPKAETGAGAGDNLTREGAEIGAETTTKTIASGPEELNNG